MSPTPRQIKYDSFSEQKVVCASSSMTLTSLGILGLGNQGPCPTIHTLAYKSSRHSAL